MAGKIVCNSRQSFLERLPAPSFGLPEWFFALPAESARNPLHDDKKDYFTDHWV
jgi:hypothetical protein